MAAILIAEIRRQIKEEMFNRETKGDTETEGKGGGLYVIKEECVCKRGGQARQRRRERKSRKKNQSTMWICLFLPLCHLLFCLWHAASKNSSMCVLLEAKLSFHSSLSSSNILYEYVNVLQLLCTQFHLFPICNEEVYQLIHQSVS